jgi:hypothetical protein
MLDQTPQLLILKAQEATATAFILSTTPQLKFQIHTEHYIVTAEKVIVDMTSAYI